MLVTISPSLTTLKTFLILELKSLTKFSFPVLGWPKVIKTGSLYSALIYPLLTASYKVRVATAPPRLCPTAIN